MAFPSTMIDAVESWLAGQSFWVQVPIVLAILVPLCWLLAGLIDKVVEYALRRHTARAAAADAVSSMRTAQEPGARSEVRR